MDILISSWNGRFVRSAALAALAPLIAASSFSVQRGYVGLEFSDLMKIKVTSVERREKPIGPTPAAIFVLTAEDIRRSGATNIPDLLRGVPGVSVSRVNGNTWAISARGGQDTVSNRLLVMIDGRSVYSPLFAGVFWDVQDIPLETIDRIEVIRGPGGSVWGANAVNGVINIIRKDAKSAVGTSASVAAGNEERFIGNVETGWKIGERTFGAVYGRYREFDDMGNPRGSGGADDAGHQGGGGFRVDGTSEDKSSWLVSGDAYNGQFHENRSVTSVSPPVATIHNDETTVSGANLLTRWVTPVTIGTLSIQAYYDWTDRRIPQTFSESRHTADVTAQHQFLFARIHRLTYGAGYRVTHDRVGNSFGVSFDPDAATDAIANFFLQDEMQFTPKWLVNVGTKFERNDYTGWEFQPGVRTSYEVLPNQFLWSAVSHAVRTPTRLDSDLTLRSASGPALLEVDGSDDFVSEKLTAYDIGYRGQLSPILFAGVSGFYNKYTHLRGATPLTPVIETSNPPPYLVQPILIDNDLWGETFGAEFSSRLKVTDAWRLTGTYSYLHQRFHVSTGRPDILASTEEVIDPVHQAYLRSSWNIGPRVELDAGARWVGEMQGGAVDDYAAVDARVGWRPVDPLTLELIGQNVFDPVHKEWATGNEVERSIYGKATWGFR